MPTPPERDIISFRYTCWRALAYILLVAGLLQGVYIEAIHFPAHRFSEVGFTEFAQSALLVMTAILLVYARSLTPLRHVTLLLLAFTVASLIREQDSFLDHNVFDGAWQILVSLVVLPALYVVIRNRHAFVSEFERYANSFSFGLFAAGFLTTYVFSRLYGRTEFWEVVLGDAYLRTFKNVAEEVTELLGYSLILIAMLELVLMLRRWRRRGYQD